MRLRFRNILLFSLLLLTVGMASGQQLYVGPTSPYDPKWAIDSDFDGSILFCRGYYNSVREDWNNEVGWWTDYPGADHNFLVRLSELTEVRVRFDQYRIPFYVTLRLDDPLLYKCPILFMSGVGTLGFSPSEVASLRLYLEKGGFLWTDDSWGSEAWDQWVREIRRVLPSGAYPMVDIDETHPIMNMLYSIEGGIWQQPHAGWWMEQHSTSERGEDSAIPYFKGIENEDGRLMVVSTHNTDIADGWEEEKDPYIEYLNEFSPRSYALGINIFLYALTH